MSQKVIRSATLMELPKTSPGKTGWPWTEESEKLNNKTVAKDGWLKISVVTPSFSHGHLIEETVRSILLQSYPDLEYIIIDGGSTDKTLEIIKKYEPWLAYWVSEADRGQSHALNKGFRKSSGEIMAYLNSDDIYYPGTLQLAARLLLESDSDLLIGALDLAEIQEDQIKISSRLCPSKGQSVHRFPIFANGRVEDFQFLQPSMFWRREIWEKTGDFNEAHHYNMDREWCLRALSKGARVITTDQVLARFLYHPDSKSVRSQEGFTKDAIKMYKNFSQMREFRKIPCLQAGLYHRMQLLQDTYYQKSKRFFDEGEMIQAYYFLTLGRVARRMRLAVGRSARVQRKIDKRQSHDFNQAR